MKRKHVMDFISKDGGLTWIRTRTISKARKMAKPGDKIEMLVRCRGGWRIKDWECF